MKSKPIIYYPKSSLNICGHNPPPVMVGLETRYVRYDGNKVLYVAEILEGPCAICNKAREKKFYTWAKKMDKRSNKEE